jgi:hypothetical protein
MRLALCAIAFAACQAQQPPAPVAAQPQTFCQWTGTPPYQVCVPTSPPPPASTVIETPGAPSSAVAIGMSPQPPPFPIVKGMVLYSVGACGATARTISMAQIRAVAEQQGVTWLDPAFYSNVVAGGIAKTPTSRFLSATKWTSDGFAVGAAVVTVLKTQSARPTNTTTWAEITTTAAATGSGISVFQPFLQAQVNAQIVTMTSGVQASLVTEGGIYSMLAGCGGFTRSVMFFGSGAPAGELKGILQ